MECLEILDQMLYLLVDIKADPRKAPSCQYTSIPVVPPNAPSHKFQEIREYYEKVVQPLVNGSYIKVDKPVKGRRQVTVTLTDKGERLYDALLGKLEGLLG